MIMSDSEILAVIRAQEDATARGDANAVINAMSLDAVLFDLPPPLVLRGDEARDVKALDDWFATWEDGVTVRLDSPQIIVDGDLAVAFGPSRMVGTKTEGTKVDSWSRRTVVLRRVDGSWRIVHDHLSFPMSMDGGDRALTTLEP